jgi:NADPH:quinone reductase-like Zn-dependent oxidoreductase
MRAMVLNEPKRPLELRDVPKPKPGRGQLLVRVSTCAVCRTDLHVVDGELPDPKLPLIPGHQIVGRVEEIGENSNFAIGDRVGSRGLAGPMVIARIAYPAERIFAITHALPVTRSTAVTPSSRSRMRDTVFICLSVTMTSKLHRCFAQG